MVVVVVEIAAPYARGGGFLDDPAVVAPVVAPVAVAVAVAARPAVVTPQAVRAAADAVRDRGGGRGEGELVVVTTHIYIVVLGGRSPREWRRMGIISS
jgi:hypothetical protein